MGIDTFMRMYLVFLKQDLLLFFSWHQIYCSSPLLTEWCEPQACVWHFENSHRTSVKPQTVCWFKAISSWNVTQSCYGKPRTLTYEHTQILVTHLAKLHTYSCRHVLMYTFFFFLWRMRSIGVGVVRTTRPQSVPAMLVDWRRTRSLCAPPSSSVRTLHSDRK